MTTHRFVVELDVMGKVEPVDLAEAIEDALAWVRENDVAGTEVLNHRIKGITVDVLPELLP